MFTGAKNSNACCACASNCSILRRMPPVNASRWPLTASQGRLSWWCRKVRFGSKPAINFIQYSFEKMRRQPAIPIRHRLWSSQSIGGLIARDMSWTPSGRVSSRIAATMSGASRVRLMCRAT